MGSTIVKNSQNPTLVKDAWAEVEELYAQANARLIANLSQGLRPPSSVMRKVGDLPIIRCGTYDNTPRLLVPSAPKDMYRARRQSDAKALIQSKEMAALKVVAAALDRRLNGKILKGLTSKASGTQIEKILHELLTEQMPALARELGGSQGTDLAPLRLDFKSSRSATPQFSSKQLCGCERALGASEHLLVVCFDVVKGLVQVDNVYFVPAWLHSDHQASSFTESLRRQVRAGDITGWEAAQRLTAAGVVEKPCSRLFRRLVSSDPISIGALVMSHVDEAWRVRPHKTVTETDPDQGERLVIVRPGRFKSSCDGDKALEGKIKSRKKGVS